MQGAFINVYKCLRESIFLDEGWPEGNWPISGAFQPVEFEIVVGAILTQNTNWRAVKSCLSRLVDAGLRDTGSVLRSSPSTLENAIRPAGFFRKKSLLLKRVAGAILDFDGDFFAQVTRKDLLSISGIGPETADAILLYACGRPEFVADGYTRRIFGRLGLLENRGYQDAKMVLESHLPSQVSLFREFHALLVEHAKIFCKKVPRCSSCVLRKDCRTAASAMNVFNAYREGN